MGRWGGEVGMWAPSPSWHWDVSPGGDERHSTPSGAGAKSSKRKKVKQGMQQLIPPGKSPCREEGQHLWVLQTHHNLNLIPGPSNPRRSERRQNQWGFSSKKGVNLTRNRAREKRRRCCQPGGRAECRPSTRVIILHHPGVLHRCCSERGWGVPKEPRN